MIGRIILGKLRRRLLSIVVLVCLLHLVQLVIYPINRKWYVALAASVLHGITAYGIYKNKRYGYLWALAIPLIAGIFVASVLGMGLGKRPEGIKFNPFTAIAGVFEIAAVYHSVILTKAKIWKHKF